MPITKRVIVYLDTGITKEHLVEAEDDSEYEQFISIWIDAIKESIGGLIFTDPYCIYKVENIIAIELLDPPAQTNKLPMGFVKPKQ